MAGVIALALPVHAAPTLTYQGQLYGAVNATYDMSFRLYVEPEGSEARTRR